ncbi:MAG: hypothetical protein LBM96_10755 [Methanobrevibacter sp.]|jgi:hypothetical protein|nr:hypothetical protein [Candidatus Methanoflexus mossambicus]
MMDKRRGKPNPYKIAWREFKGKKCNIARNGRIIHKNVTITEVDVDNQVVMFNRNGFSGMIKLAGGNELIEVET